MRIVLLMRIVPLMLVAGCSAQAPFGTWKLNWARSTFSGGTQPRSYVVRIEPHPKGEVFTLDRTEADGRTTSSSTILYFDGARRDFQDFDCTGTQSSRRLDSQTVEILRQCGAGEATRLIRRTSGNQNELVLEIRETHTDGHRSEGRLVLSKQ
jgi:hypothetical protein